MKKQILLVIIGISWANTMYCQDYIVKDSIYSSGIVKRLPDGSISYQKLKSDSPTRYSANGIQEFGVAGKIFESISINNDTQFRERIANSRPLKVFTNEDQLIIKVKDTIKVVTKKELLAYIQKLPSCSHYTIPKKVISTHKAIEYNLVVLAKSCKPADLLFNRTTLLFSLNQLEVKGDGGLLTPERPQGQFTSPSIGVGKEFPFYKPKNLFLTAEININLLSGNIRSNTNMTKKIAAHYILLPIGLKWIIANSRVKPYLKGGFIPSFSTVSTSTSFTSSSSSTIQYGLTSSVGLQFPVQQINAIQLELRLIDLAKTSFQEYELGMTSTSFSIAYSF